MKEEKYQTQMTDIVLIIIQGLFEDMKELRTKYIMKITPELKKKRSRKELSKIT